MTEQHGPGNLLGSARDSLKTPPMQTASFFKDLFDLSGKTAVVIGGTGELCGTMAVGLARAGAEVVLGGRIPEKAEKRLAEIEVPRRQGLLRPGRCDLARVPAAPARYRARALRPGGHPHQRRGHQLPHPVSRHHRGGIPAHHRHQPLRRLPRLPGLRPVLRRGSPRRPPSSISARFPGSIRSRASSPTRSPRPRSTTSPATSPASGRTRTSA